MTSAVQSETCFSAVADLDEAMRESFPNNTYFVVGGIATAAYQHEGTVLDTNSRMAYAHEAANLATMRPNRTLRDVDVLVNRVLDPDEAMAGRQAAEKAIDGRLEVSLFGFDDYDHGILRRFEPLSRRLQNGAGECFYKMGAAVQEVPAETYAQPWRLVLPNGTTINALHPVGHALAYEVRSVGGLRGKDYEKHAVLNQNIAHKLGAVALADAEMQFDTWRKFANSLQAIRNGNYDQLDPKAVRPGASPLELRAMRWQGRALGALERQEQLVSIAQSPLAQRILKRAIGSV